MGQGKRRGLKLFLWKRNENYRLGTAFLAHRRIVSAVKRAEFLSTRMSFTVLRDRWFNIIILNVDAPSEEKSDGSKDSFYEELEQDSFIIFLSTT